MGIYKNPLTATQIGAPESVGNSRFFGTNFSVLGIGGHMEVFKLADLNFTVNNLNGPVEDSDNKIPVRLNINPSPGFNVLTLNSDNISSGRRRLGMRVYVYENETLYEYNIPAYETLFNAATATTAVNITQFGTTVDTSTAAGIALVNAWTASTIEGITPGFDHTTANWRIVSEAGLGVDIYVTGGTYSSGTATFKNNQGGTFNVTGFVEGGGGIPPIIITGQTGDGSMRKDNSNCSINNSTVFGYTNTGSGNCSGVLGGSSNMTTGNCSTILGGYLNKALSKAYGTIGGGTNNMICSDGLPFGYEVIGGGISNLISGNTSVIGGGTNNKIYGSTSSILGGTGNCIEGNCSNILGGINNYIKGKEHAIVGGSTNKVLFNNNGCDNAIVGGCCNNITGDVSFSFVGAGFKNNVTGNFSSILGGCSNLNGGASSVILGGQLNSNTGNHSAILGGQFTSNTGNCSVVLGGYCNISKGDFSLIGGGQYNSVTGSCSMVLGGTNNAVNTNRGVIIHGSNNLISADYYAMLPKAILGGTCNSLLSRSSSSLILNGFCNVIKDFSSGFGQSTINLNHGALIGGGESNTLSNDPLGYCYGKGNAFILLGAFNNIYEGGESGILVGRNNNISGSCTSLIGTGTFNLISGSTYSSVNNGSGNTVSASCFTTIVGGCKNLNTGNYSSILGGQLNSNSGSFSSIIGGSNNSNSCSCSFIIGNTITSDRSNTTFVNNLSIKNIPLSSSGLPSGSVWSDSGTLKIVT